MRALRSALACAARAIRRSACTTSATRDRELAIAFLDVQIAEHESGALPARQPSLALGEAVFGVDRADDAAFAAVADAGRRRRRRASPRYRIFSHGARRSIAAPIPDEWRAKCLRNVTAPDPPVRDGIARWIALEAIADSLADRLMRAASGARRSSAFEDVRLGCVG